MNVEEMMKLTGDTGENRKAAEQFCQDATNEIKQRQHRIEQIVNLAFVLDSHQLSIAADCQAGIRHLMESLQDVAQAHERTPLKHIFRETVRANAGALYSAQRHYSQLHHMLHSSHEYEVRDNMRYDDEDED